MSDTETSDERLIGTVDEFYTQRGFGHIERDGDGPEDEKRLFVHWKEIQTEARWPTLEKGAKVEYSIGREKKDGGKDRVKAVNVTALGGDKLDCSMDVEGDVIEGGPYKGKVDYYHFKKGFGFVIPDDEIPGVELKTGDAGKSKRLHVNRCDIISDDEPPTLQPGDIVEFKVYKTEKGYSAREVSGPDGAKIHHEKTEKKKSENKPKSSKRGRDGGNNWSRGGGGGNNWGKKSWGGPKRARYSDGGDVEIGLVVQKNHVGGIIGTKGSNIRQIMKDSGANMQFGQDDVFCKDQAHRVLAISGSEDTVKDACKIIAKKLGEVAQSIDHKIVFLVPESYCGVLIGKKGATIKRIQESSSTGDNKRARVNISDDPVVLPGASPANTCTLYGGQKNVALAIDEVTEVLGQISNRIQEEQMQFQAPMMRGGWGGGRMRSGGFGGRGGGFRGRRRRGGW